MLSFSSLISRVKETLEANQRVIFFLTLGTSLCPNLPLCWASARCLTRDGVPFSCLQAGRTRGAEGGVVSGRKWYPKYYPYGMSKMAAAAERRASACFLPPPPPASCTPEKGITCSVPERRYHHTGGPAS